MHIYLIFNCTLQYNLKIKFIIQIPFTLFSFEIPTCNFSGLYYMHVKHFCWTNRFPEPIWCVPITPNKWIKNRYASQRSTHDVQTVENGLFIISFSLSLCMDAISKIKEQCWTFVWRWVGINVMISLKRKREWTCICRGNCSATRSDKLSSIEKWNSS